MSGNGRLEKAAEYATEEVHGVEALQAAEELLSSGFTIHIPPGKRLHDELAVKLGINNPYTQEAHDEVNRRLRVGSKLLDSLLSEWNEPSGDDPAS